MNAGLDGSPVAKKRKLSKPTSRKVTSPRKLQGLDVDDEEMPTSGLVTKHSESPSTHGSNIVTGDLSKSKPKRTSTTTVSKEHKALSNTTDPRKQDHETANARASFPSGKRKGRPRKTDQQPESQSAVPTSSRHNDRRRSARSSKTSSLIVDSSSTQPVGPGTSTVVPVSSPGPEVDTRSGPFRRKPIGRPRKSERLAPITAPIVSVKIKSSIPDAAGDSGELQKSQVSDLQAEQGKALLNKGNASKTVSNQNSARRSSQPLTKGPKIINRHSISQRSQRKDADEQLSIEVSPIVPKKFRLTFGIQPAAPIITQPAHIAVQPRFPSFRDYLGSFVSLEEDMSLLAARERREALRLLRSRLNATSNHGERARLQTSISVPMKSHELPRPPCFQDDLNRHARNFSKLMQDERRRHLGLGRKIAGMVQGHFRRQSTADERQHLELGKLMRQHAKRVANEIKRKWRLAEREVFRRAAIKAQEAQRAAGKQHLSHILEHSTNLLDSRTRIFPDLDETPDLSSDGEEDHYLSLEELRLKYANIPEVDLLNSSSGSVGDARSSTHAGQVAMSPTRSASDPDLDEQGAMDSELDSSTDSTSDHHSENLGLLALYPELKTTIATNSIVNTTTANESVVDRNPVHTNDLKVAKEASSMHNRSTRLKSQGLLELASEDEAQDLSDDSPMDSELEEPSESCTSSNELDDDHNPGLDWLYSNPIRPSLHRSEIEVPPSPDLRPSHSNQERRSSCDPDAPQNSSADVVQIPQEIVITPKKGISPEDRIETNIPSLLRGKLREYQHKGLDWMASLYQNGTNGILADEMGLGKTIQTISLLAWLACEQHVWGTHLIVVPTSVMLNWETEFKKFAPGLKVLTYYGSPKERKEKRRGWSKTNALHVVITSYQLVITDAPVFRRKRWEYMILDEAHNIKNFKSQRWQTLLNFNTRHRLLLTGTPLQNNLNELWSLLYFLMPQGLSDSAHFANLNDFQEWFARPVDKMVEDGAQLDRQARETVAKLHTILRPYILRRLKADVEKQMPGKFEHVISCRLSKRQRFLYDDFMSRSGTRAIMASGNFLSIINCFMQLRKVCNHPDLFETRQIVTSLAIPRTAVSEYKPLELLIKKFLGLYQKDSVDISGLNMNLAAMEANSKDVTLRTSQLTEDLRTASASFAELLDSNTDVMRKAKFQQNAREWSSHMRLHHLSYLNRLRCDRIPVYGTSLLRLLNQTSAEQCRSFDMSNPIRALHPLPKERVRHIQSIVQRFACLTPKIVALDVPSAIIPAEISSHPELKLFEDMTHFARTATAIAFPDKRLLQFDCGKLQRLAILLRSLLSGGHRVLIFTQMTKMLDILEQFLNIHGYLYFRLDGSTKIEVRQSLTERFNSDPRVPIFILSTRSGGLGINLTGADTVIFYDSDWNPCMDRQCQDRAHRIGQTRDVHIYRFVSEHTIEQNIMRKANQKRMLDNIVIGEGDFTTDFFNQVDWKAMLGDEMAANIVQAPDVELEEALAAAEEVDDAQAAQLAQQEMAIDMNEFSETGLTRPERVTVDSKEAVHSAISDSIGSIDDYMVMYLEREHLAQT